MKKLMQGKKTIESFYSNVKEFMKQNEVEYKILGEDRVDFSKSDIDIVLRSYDGLEKIKAFTRNSAIQTIIKINNKHHFYFIVTDEENIHAFDFTVGLVSSVGVVCSGDYFFQSSDHGVDFQENYRFLKNAVKHNPSFYTIKENRKSFLFRMLLNCNKVFKYLRTVFLRNTNGISLVLLGADGSGKSTASDFIQSSFSTERQLFQVKKIYFKPNVFKIKPDKKMKDNIPHNHSSYSSFLSICKVIYVFLNYLLYQPMCFFRKKNGHLILFDRHFYDMLIDPQRYRINKAGLWAAKLLSRLLQKPDAVIVLTSKVSELSARKPGEVTEKLLTSLNNSYKNFSLKNVNVCHINNDNSVNELKEKVFTAVLRSMKT